MKAIYITDNVVIYADKCQLNLLPYISITFPDYEEPETELIWENVEFMMSIGWLFFGLQIHFNNGKED